MNDWLPKKWVTDPGDRMTAFPGRADLRSALLSRWDDRSTTPKHRQLIRDHWSDTKTHTVRSYFNQHVNWTHFQTLNRLHALWRGAELHREAEGEKPLGSVFENKYDMKERVGDLMAADQNEPLHRSSRFLRSPLSEEPDSVCSRLTVIESDTSKSLL